MKHSEVWWIWEVNLEACFTSLRFTAPAAENVTQTRKMKNVLCQAQTYVTGLNHISLMTQVMIITKWKNKQLCCIMFSAYPPCEIRYFKKIDRNRSIIGCRRGQYICPKMWKKSRLQGILVNYLPDVLNLLHY